MPAAPRPLAAAVLASTLALAAPVHAAAGWRLPVRGEVLRAFAYDERAPFAAGARRGVDLAAPRAAPVRSACSGRVRHAGRVPVRGLGVSVRCAGLTATHLGLAELAVGRGQRVRRGQRLGRAGGAGVVRLGARVTARRFGWIDPLALVTSSPAPPAGPLPRARPRRAPPALPAPAAVRAPAARRVPLLAWLGVALVAAGVPLGALVTLRRGRLSPSPARTRARRRPVT